MAHDVFVSYSSKDKAIADAVVSALENNHIRCWYAPRDIQPSEKWGEAITRAIEGAKIFLVIFSGNANFSQHVLDELLLAINSQATILPFRIENLEPQGAMKLHLSSRHWLNAFDPSWHSHIKKLVQTVSDNLEKSIDENKILIPIEITRKAQTPKKKTKWIISAVLMGAFVITAVWYGLSQRPEPETVPEVTPSAPIEAPEIQEMEPEEPSSEIEEDTTPVVYNLAEIEDLCNSDAYGCARIEPGQTIKIGMGLPLSGQSENFGTDAKQSGLLAIADAGDFNGFRFELMPKDDKGTSEGGAAVAEEFIVDPTVVAIAGHAFSGSTEAALPFYQQHGFPILNVSATNPDFLEIGSKVFNHLLYTDKAAGFSSADYIYHHIGAKNIAILHSYDDYGKELSNFVNVGYEALGGNVIAFGNLTEDPGMRSDIIDNRAEVVYYCGLEVEANIMALMISADLKDAVFFGCDAAHQYFLNDGIEDKEGFYFSIFSEPKESPDKSSFDKSYQKLYGISPGVLTPISWHYYDSTMILTVKVKEVGLLCEDGALYVPRGALAQAVRDLENYIGISGVYTCSNMGDCNTEGPRIVKVMNGELIPLN